MWHVTTEISDKASVDYLMGVVRDGTSVAQVGFVAGPQGRPSPPGDFLGVVERALARLDAMPAPEVGLTCEEIPGAAVQPCARVRRIPSDSPTG